jgi:hypothetical protein
MKKLYFILSFLLFAGFAMAQNNEAIAGSCKNSTAESVTIVFDESMNCTNSPGDLAGLAEIGFHSGYSGWTNVVTWDAATAVKLVNDGNDKFTGTLTPATYYVGAVWATLDVVNFVLNQGPAVPAEPWASEGKDNNADGTACQDFFLTLATLAECTSSTIDHVLSNSIAVTPNPFSETAVISFSNTNNQVFDITVTSLTGQVVRNFQNVSGSAVELERGNMTTGMYFVTFVSETGKIATTKVVVR